MPLVLYNNYYITVIIMWQERLLDQWGKKLGNYLKRISSSPTLGQLLTQGGKDGIRQEKKQRGF